MCRADTSISQGVTMNRSNVLPHAEINISQELRLLRNQISAYRRNVGLHPQWDAGFDNMDDYEYSHDPYYRDLHAEVEYLLEVLEGRTAGHFPW